MTSNFEACPECDHALEEIRERVRMRMGRRSATVEVERMACAHCGNRFATPDQMSSAQRSLATLLRLQEGLLPPERVREIRVQYGLTQPEFERLLGVGPKTVVRWERGTVFQNRATDELLRLIESVPAAYEFLATRRGLLAPAFGDPAVAQASHERHVRYVARRKRVLPEIAGTGKQVVGFQPKPPTTRVSISPDETAVPTIPEMQLT